MRCSKDDQHRQAAVLAAFIEYCALGLILLLAEAVFFLFLFIDANSECCLSIATAYCQCECRGTSSGYRVQDTPAEMLQMMQT